MSIIHTSLRRPATKAAAAAAAVVALAGGLYGAQAATADSDEPGSVIRAETAHGGSNGGQVVAAETPRIDERPAP